MALLNYIPVVAHVKAVIHLICNDVEGAKQTFDTCSTKAPILSHIIAGVAKLDGNDEVARKCWEGGNSSLNALPVVGHIKGLGHYVCGDIEGGKQAMKDATITTFNIADGIPGVGHAKALLHYACDDQEGGNRAMRQATRTLAVMGAAAAGSLAGPAGAVAGSVTAGGGWDTTAFVLTNGKEANGITRIFSNPSSVDSYLDAGLSVLGDGYAGYSKGKNAEKGMVGSGNSGGTSSSVTGGGGTSASATGSGAAAAQQLAKKTLVVMKPEGVIFVKMDVKSIFNYLYEKLVTTKQQDIVNVAKTGLNTTTVASSALSNDILGNRSSHSTTTQQQNYGKDNSKDNQPPQQPNNTKKTYTDDAHILFLYQRLTELLDQIRQRLKQDPMQLDRQFQIESFQEMFSIVLELISNGHTLSISWDHLNLAISSHDGSWRELIEYQIADYLDVHDQLLNQRFIPLNPGSSCPIVLSAQFQGSRLILSPQTNHSSGHAIYGIRCRLCNSRAGPSNINYVGLTKRSAHERVCGEHARAAKNYAYSTYNSLYSDMGEMAYRPMYRHVEKHYFNGDIHEGYKLGAHYYRDAFRQVMDVILLPISGGPEKLRSWEAFWQFFFHCRDFFWGWSQK